MNGGTGAWASRKQKCTSLSTTEAEYVAASSTAKDITWYMERKKRGTKERYIERNDLQVKGHSSGRESGNGDVK